MPKNSMMRQRLTGAKLGLPDLDFRSPHERRKENPDYRSYGEMAAKLVDDIVDEVSGRRKEREDIKRHRRARSEMEKAKARARQGGGPILKGFGDEDTPIEKPAHAPGSQRKTRERRGEPLKGSKTKERKGRKVAIKAERVQKDKERT